MSKEELLSLAKSIDCEYTIGIWSEIDSFLEYESEKIMDSSMTYNDCERSFYLKLKMNEFNPDGIDELFKKLVRFLEYNHATFYVKDNIGETVEYYLLSATRDRKGFLLKTIFF